MKEHDNLKKAKSLWNKPVLTVLVRNNPEETVLTACKTRGILDGPGAYQMSCMGMGGCAQCANLSSS